MDRSSRTSHLWSNVPSALPHPLRHFVYRRVPRHPNADSQFLLLVHSLPAYSSDVSCAPRLLMAHPAAPRFARSTASDTAGPITGTAPPAGISPLLSRRDPARRRHSFRPYRYRVLRSIRNRSNDSHRSRSGAPPWLSHPAEPDGRSRRHARLVRHTLPQYLWETLAD